MPQHIYSIPAQGLSLDAQTNRVTLYAVLEELSAPGFPVLLPELNVVTVWKRLPGEEGGEFMQRTRFLDPEGQVKGLFESSFVLEKPRHRMLGKILLVPFEVAGTFTIEVTVRRADSEKYDPPVLSYPIEVTLQDQAAEQDLLQASGGPTVVS